MNNSSFNNDDTIMDLSPLQCGNVIVYPNGFPNEKKIQNPCYVKLIREYPNMTIRPQYIGKAGQLAVMSEFALHGYNVAMPEIDIGDDIFVVNDETGAMWRLQVKTSLGVKQKKSHRCQFSIRTDQVSKAVTPDITYVLTTRLDEKWDFVIIPRSVLKHMMINGTGSKSQRQGKEYLQLNIVFYENGDIKMSKESVSIYRNNWDIWQPIK